MNKLTLLFIGITESYFSSNAQQGMGVGNNNPQEMLDVSGAIKIGTDLSNTTGAPTGGAGTVRFRAGTFEGWDGSAWIPLGGGSDADSDWTVSGANQYSAVTGNVGIGETNPVFKLDVGHPGANNQIRVRGNWVSNHANNARANFIDWNFGVGAGRAGSAGDATVLWSFNGAGRGILFASTSNGLSQHFGQMQHNMYIDGATGNVGIGTTSPTRKLSIARSNEAPTGQLELQTSGGISTGNYDGLYFTFGPSGSIPLGSFRSVFHNNGFPDLAFYTRNLGNPSTEAERMRILNNGNVGIGTTNPTEKLDVLGGTRSYNAGFGQVSFTDGVQNFANYGSDNHGAITIGQNFYSNGGTLRIANTHVSLSGVGIHMPGNQQTGQGNMYFYTNSPASVTAGAAVGGIAASKMTLTGTGRLGIGTTNPIAPLHVENTAGANYGNFTFYALNQYTNTPNNPTSCCGGFVNGIAIHANGRVMASEFDAFSDARIKNVVGFSNSEEDLKKLLGIQITDYRMKDAAKDVKPYKKAIAQQVEEVYPQAVSTVTDVIPNIYKVATIENGFIPLEADITKGDVVKLIFDNGIEMAEVSSVSENGFNVNTESTGDVFVYGKQVDDFRTVDYEAISMLNVSATQELFKMIQALQDENKELKTAVTEFKTLAEDIEALKQWTNFSEEASKN